MRKNQKRSADDYIRTNYSETIEGTTSYGSVGKGCYRVDVLGEQPSECHCHVDREGNELKYICFGAKCGIRGVVSEGGKRSQIQRQDTQRVELGLNQRDCNLPNSFVYTLSRPCLQWLEEYDLSGEDVASFRCGTDRSNGRLVLPVYHYGENRGWVSRRVEGDYGKKWYNYVEEGTVFSVLAKTEGCIIVENPVSAIRMNKLTGMTTIALLGHKLSDKKLRSINEVVKYQGVEKAYLFLDPDVEMKKKFDVKRGLTRVVNSVTIINTNKKPKEITEQELKEMLCYK